MTNTENGVGTTCSNALSKKFVITSQRDGKKKKLTFEYGKLVDEKIEDYKGKKTGTTVMMIPDENILKTIKSDYKDLLSLCETMAYISKVPIKINTHMTTKNGKDINEIYHFKNGIKDLMNSLTRSPINKPIYMQYDGENMGMEVIFVYDPENELIAATGENNLIISFANFCTTVDGGTHVEGFKSGLSTYMTKFVRDNCLNKKEQNEMSVLGEDVRYGLLAVVNVYLEEASFIGQVKQKLGTPEMATFVKNALVNGLNQWAKDNSQSAKKLGDYIKNTAKTRINSSKERKQYLNKNYSNRIDSIGMKAWSGKANCKKLKHEIYIVEGDENVSPKNLSNCGESLKEYNTKLS